MTGPRKKPTTVQRAILAALVLRETPWEEHSDGFHGPPLQRRVVKLGRYVDLDPCGRDHDWYTAFPWRCKRFWQSLERQCKRRGLVFAYEPEGGDPVVVEVRQVSRDGRPLATLPDGRYRYQD